MHEEVGGTDKSKRGSSARQLEQTTKMKTTHKMKIKIKKNIKYHSHACSVRMLKMLKMILRVGDPHSIHMLTHAQRANSIICGFEWGGHPLLVRERKVSW